MIVSALIFLSAQAVPATAAAADIAGPDPREA